MAQRRLKQIILCCRFHLFQPAHPKGHKLPHLPSHLCSKPAEPIVAKKWSQQLLSSKKNRYLSTEYLLTLITSKNLKETRQVTQNYTNFSPGHKVPSNYGSKTRSHCWGSYSKCVQKALFPWSRQSLLQSWKRHQAGGNTIIKASNFLPDKHHSYLTGQRQLGWFNWWLTAGISPEGSLKW